MLFSNSGIEHVSKLYILKSRSKIGIVLHTAACFTAKRIMNVRMYSK